VDDQAPPEPSLAQKLAADLSEDEIVLAADAWFQYLQLWTLAGQRNPDQAESERHRLDRMAAAIGGIWQMILVSRGYNFHAWEVRLVDPPKGLDTLGQGGAMTLPTGANQYGVILTPNPKPPQ
jgi:hypothetical protein